MRPVPWPTLGCALWALGLAGCELDLASVAEPPAVMDSSVPGPGAHDGGSPADAARADGGDTTEADGGAQPEAGGPLKHASCELPRPSVLPPEPLVMTDARGRPVFDYFLELSCDDPAVSGYPTCESYRGEPAIACEHCTSEERLCIGANFKPSDEACAPLVSKTLPCATCVPLEAKRKACCLGMDNACEAWPFEGKSKVREPCAVHADCELGLLCTTSRDAPSASGQYAFGLCTCPGADYPANECWDDRVPP